VSRSAPLDAVARSTGEREAAALDPRAAVLALLRRHGRNATSFQVMEPGLRYWFDGPASAPTGCVAYAETRGAWVAAGAPVAPADEVWAVGQRFAGAARTAGRRAVFVCVERWASEEPWLESLAIGAQPIWRPADWPATLAGSRGLREQLRRARAKGVAVRAVPAAEVADPSSAVRRGADALIERWLGSRKMAPMGFLVELHPYEFAEERRYLVAEQGERVVGFLAAVPVYRRSGWLLEDFLRAPEAPNGTMELLFDGAMTALAADAADHVTMGLAPLAGVTGLLGQLRDRGRWLYDFEGVRAFKAKLRPAAWEPVYLAWPRGRGPTAAVLDCLRAFARGSLLRFGLDILVHRRRQVAAGLAALLVPWTLLLALAPARWFPSPEVQLAWTAFDLTVVTLLAVLARRWKPALARALALLVAADAALTALQALTWNLPRLRAPLDLAVVAASIAAPTFAAVFLRRAASPVRSTSR
jgi:phosphatidylglycerol lysyltransferase